MYLYTYSCAYLIIEEISKYIWVTVSSVCEWEVEMCIEWASLPFTVYVLLELTQMCIAFAI